MLTLIGEFFSYLSQRFYFSAVVFVIIFGFFLKVIDSLILGNLSDRIQYLRDPNKRIYLGLLIVGLLALLMGAFFNIYFKYPLSWFICSGALVVGGLLGLIPFSFIEHKRKKYGK